MARRVLGPGAIQVVTKILRRSIVLLDQDDNSEWQLQALAIRKQLVKDWIAHVGKDFVKSDMGWGILSRIVIFSMDLPVDCLDGELPEECVKEQLDLLAEFGIEKTPPSRVHCFKQLWPTLQEFSYNIRDLDGPDPKAVEFRTLVQRILKFPASAFEIDHPLMQ